MRGDLLRTWLIILLVGLLAVACGNPVRPAPTRLVPTLPADLNVQAPDVDHGAQLWQEDQCVACHGPQALGGIGPALAQTDLPFPTFLSKVRNAIPPKPAFSEAELSNQDLYDIYGWVNTLASQGQPQPRPQFAVVKVQPGQEDLPDGPILGMSLWTGFGCDSCHGAFAQGADDGPALAGLTYPYEMERANMRQTAGQIPEHAQSFMRDTVLKRLYKWLQEGANPEGGC